ncbi:MAG TPA: polysaccharide deacetylase family protein [Acidimicrobiales bacterium]|nr:polysaccharide deacetylase family protein [Acidimicrobiales bacterium]
MFRRNVILCYHRVAEGVDDPFGISVSPANFAAQLEELQKVAEISTLDELSTSGRRRRVVVTFDDGYADNLWQAMPIAKAKGVPMTVYVTSGRIDDHRGFWWDRMSAIFGRRPEAVHEVELSLSSGPVRVPIGARGTGADLSAVRSHLLPLPVAEIERVLDDVADSWSVSRAADPDARSLTTVELAQLAAEDVVTIGAHTVDHPRLADRPAEEQHLSVSESKAELEQRLGRRVDHFAYPYGGTDAFDDRTVAAVRQAGFSTACTTLPGSAEASSDPLRLPRRIAADWGRLRFRAQMLRWGLL